jgi:serine/threonine-protein kinase
MRDALDGYLHRSSRPVGAREVSQLVTGLFGEERERIRGIIDEQMKQMLRETAQMLPVPSLELWANSVDHTPTAVTGRRRAPVSAPESDPYQAGLYASDRIPGTGSGTFVGANVSAQPRARGPRTGLIVGASVAVVSIVGVVLAVVFIGIPGGSSSTPSAPTTTAEAPPTAAKTIELEITFGPPGATAKLDGVALAHSPFVAQMPRDGTAHTLEVSAPGYVPQSKMLSYESDIDLSIVLEEEASSADPVVSAEPKPDPRRVPPPPTPGGKSHPPPPAGGDGKEPLGIDEENPYGK